MQVDVLNAHNRMGHVVCAFWDVHAEVGRLDGRRVPSLRRPLAVEISSIRTGRAHAAQQHQQVPTPTAPSLSRSPWHDATHPKEVNRPKVVDFDEILPLKSAGQDGSGKSSQTEGQGDFQKPIARQVSSSQFGNAG